MTTDELWTDVEMWFDGIEDTVSHRSYREHSLVGVRAIQLDVRKHLAWIDRALLQEVEPESLAASVLRLTDLCNRLEAENHYLKQTKVADDHYIKRLRAKNAASRKDLARKHRQLAQAYNQVKELQRTLEEMGLSRKNHQLEQDLEAADAHIEELQADIAKQNQYIEILKVERRHYASIAPARGIRGYPR